MKRKMCLSALKCNRNLLIGLISLNETCGLPGCGSIVFSVKQFGVEQEVWPQ